MSKPKSYDLLPFAVIKAAVNGDPVAIEIVLDKYEGYIAKLATRKGYDQNRKKFRFVDEDLRNQLEDKLIETILEFRFQ